MATKSFDEKVVVSDEQAAEEIRKELDNGVVDSSRKTKTPVLSFKRLTTRDTKTKWVARWAKNGRKYVWINPTEGKIRRLIDRYGIDQVTEDGIWLQS